MRQQSGRPARRSGLCERPDGRGTKKPRLASRLAAPGPSSSEAKRQRPKPVTAPAPPPSQGSGCTSRAAARPFEAFCGRRCSIIRHVGRRRPVGYVSSRRARLGSTEADILVAPDIEQHEPPPQPMAAERVECSRVESPHRICHAAWRGRATLNKRIIHVSRVIPKIVLPLLWR